MRKIIVAIVCVMLGSISLFAQNSDSVKQNKYNIQLPDIWKGKQKFLLKLSEFIEDNVAEVRDKQMCLDCKAIYSVKFFVTHPNVYYIQNIGNEVYSNYTFTSFMDVYDVKNIIVKRVYFTDTTDAFSFNINRNPPSRIRRTEKSYEFNRAPVIEKISTNDNTGGRPIQVQQELVVQRGGGADYQKMFKEEPEKFTPVDNILWEEVQNIIVAYKPSTK